ILAVSSFLLWQQYQQIKLTVSEKDEQFARADQQRRRAENNFGKVLSGMTEFLHGLDTNASLNEQQRAGLRQSLVHDMERLLEGSLNEGNPDPTARMETGWAYVHIGTFYSRIGDLVHGEEKYRKGLSVLEPLAKECPEDLGIQWIYTTCLNGLGGSLFL